MVTVTSPPDHWWTNDGHLRKLKILNQPEHIEKQLTSFVHMIQTIVPMLKYAEIPYIDHKTIKLKIFQQTWNDMLTPETWKLL